MRRTHLLPDELDRKAPILMTKDRLSGPDFGAVVWHVKRGMSGDADPSIIAEAKLRQEDRVVENPLRHVLNITLTLGHIRSDRLRYYGMDIKEERDGDGNVVTRRYSIIYAKMLLYASRHVRYHGLKVPVITDAVIKDEIEHVRVIDIPWTVRSNSLMNKSFLMRCPLMATSMPKSRIFSVS